METANKNGVSFLHKFMVETDKYEIFKFGGLKKKTDQLFHKEQHSCDLQGMFDLAKNIFYWNQMEMFFLLKRCG